MIWNREALKALEQLQLSGCGTRGGVIFVFPAAFKGLCFVQLSIMIEYIEVKYCGPDYGNVLVMDFVYRSRL